MYLIFDTETTGLPQNYKAPVTDVGNWPRLVQLAWQTHDEKGNLVAARNYIVKPDGFTIPFNSEKVHGISTERAEREGYSLETVLDVFEEDLRATQHLIAHNIEFDEKILGAEYHRTGKDTILWEISRICTKKESTDFCRIPGGKGKDYKWPNLDELHHKLFDEGFEEAHNAAADVEATARCFLELLRREVLSIRNTGGEKEVIEGLRQKTDNIVQPTVGEKAEERTERDDRPQGQAIPDHLKEVPFSHLHCHSQFSILQSTASVEGLCKKAAEDGMPGVALTDHGNMFAAFNFVKAAKENGVKPIIGCECYLTEDRHKKKFTKENKDRRSRQVFLAKDKAGYHNLAKLSSYGYLEGYYAQYPRIDRPLLLEYKEGLITTTGGLKGEVPDLILNVGEHQAEEAFKWWHDAFGADFYVELMRHDLEEERRVNEVLLRFADKYDVKVIAANNVYYLDQADANAHDILLCIDEGELQSTPIGQGRGYRFGFPNDSYYFKPQAEMKALFSDIPEAIKNTNEVVEKVEEYDLERDILLPHYPIPEGFSDQNEYLRHLTYQGAEKRYEAITEEVRERLDHELAIIENMGFPGYFLIVQDFTTYARKNGVDVGPGRGSAAGSAVAYALGITDIEPIQYKLLFERFLNPERVTMPDIDIDFDDEGRGRILQYVVDEYGAEKVAQIVTYGTMAAKSSIRDVGRVLDLPLQETDRVAKLLPDGMTLEKIFNTDIEELGQKMGQDDVERIRQFKELAESEGKEAETIQQARVIEGSVRNTGLHACGVIIAPDDIKEHIPVAVSKDSELPITQFDNAVVEDAGMLKMDFLGLKTLSIIKDAALNVKKTQGIEIDPTQVPLDDENTFNLYKNGETNGTFQFESEGMQKNLRMLQPNNIEDLIAMNALYRPGPMQFIETFIRRKHGKEEVSYPHSLLEDILKDTYGIMVYQEQIMQAAQVMAGFSLGKADILRRAMGKKKMDVMQKLQGEFIEGAKENGIDAEKAEEVFQTMLKFAEYGFNRSHSTAYSVVAYRTGYFKANYPAAYMSSVLTHNMSDIKKVSFFMEEARRMGISVLGPDVNESEYKFVVNDQGEIRFGLGALKGVGQGAVEAIVEEREANGPYTSVFDLVKRVDLRRANKKSLESLVLAGAFDSLGDHHRAQFFFREKENEPNFLDKLVKYGVNDQENRNAAQASLFDDAPEGTGIPEPPLPACEPWNTLDELNREKEIVGVYISGHPLDDHKFVIEGLCTHNLDQLNALTHDQIGQSFKVAGVVIDFAHKTSKKGNPFGVFEVADYTDSYRFVIFGDDYNKAQHLLTMNNYLFIEGKVQAHYKNEEEVECKVGQLCLLSEAREKFIRSVTLKMPYNEVNPEVMDQLEGLMERTNGENGPCQVRFRLFDPLDRKMAVDMPSKQYGIPLENAVLQKLDALKGVEYELGE